MEPKQYPCQYCHEECYSPEGLSLHGQYECPVCSWDAMQRWIEDTTGLKEVNHE